MKEWLVGLLGATSLSFAAAALAGSASAPVKSGDLPPADRSAKPGAKLWTPVSYGGKSGAMQLFFVDLESVRKFGSALELSALMINEHPSQGGVDRVEERVRFLCESRRAISLEQRYYRGAVQLHLITPEPVAEIFPDGSAWRIMIDSVCTDEIPEERTADPKNYADAFFNG
jgi:hypothetical protein